MIKKAFLFIALIIFSGSAGFFGRQYYDRHENIKHEKQLKKMREDKWSELKSNIEDQIKGFKGEAGIVVKDLQTGWEFSHNKRKLFPSASLAKIPIMAASFLAADQGRIKLDRNIALKGSDKLTGSGLLKEVPAGTTFSLERLIGFMVYDSDNTATHMVVNAVGMDYLNKTFKDFGLKSTNLSRKIADYKSRDSGIENFTTAEDMTLLLEKMYGRNLSNKAVSDKCIATLKLTRSNDRIPKYLPVEATVAHKTGLEKGVCHAVGIVFTKKGDYIICVLTNHANPCSAPSKEFIAKVSLSVYKYFEQLK